MNDTHGSEERASVRELIEGLETVGGWLAIIRQALDSLPDEVLDMEVPVETPDPEWRRFFRPC